MLHFINVVVNGPELFDVDVKRRKLCLNVLVLLLQPLTLSAPYFRFMSGSEDVERKNIPEPEFFPSVTYFTHDTGIMSASVARDFHYLLLMPEPERYFTVSLAAQQPGISQQEAEQILSEFYTRRLRRGRINIPVSRHRAHSHAVRKRTGGYKTPPVGAIPTGGDPFLDTELPQMILEHHAEAAPFM